jgi:hypothetical protein
MVAEEHDDASPDDVEPGLLLLEQPAEPSSPAGPLLPLAPPLIHPVSDRTERLVGGSLRARKALLRRAIAGSASAVEWRRGQGSASDALIYRGRSSRPLASLPWFSHITPCMAARQATCAYLKQRLGRGMHMHTPSQKRSLREHMRKWHEF